VLGGRVGERAGAATISIEKALSRLEGAREWIVW
jgi:hypothetical protein